MFRSCILLSLQFILLILLRTSGPHTSSASAAFVCTSPGFFGTGIAGVILYKFFVLIRRFEFLYPCPQKLFMRSSGPSPASLIFTFLRCFMLRVRFCSSSSWSRSARELL